ncbi:MAG: HAMP domain-containing histidine kinase [Oceanospirillaceae bacterium]|nr:HAMP domain-containing histidine kinase [Oceanospirillaceae bacterium]MCP5334084.1 HAMP domain-containing histidine kinase [Oceanospirillaceae bacterium]MCP5351280.1 HAMP domain-containing histidine kinase [Oceanospirillaceae bacterium]
MVITSLRLVTYSNSINSAYHDIQLIVSVHIDELNDVLAADGVKGVIQRLPVMLRESGDVHLYMGVRAAGEITGNLHVWPKGDLNSHRWWRMTLPYYPAQAETDIYFRLIPLDANTQLLVGYDLQGVELIRKTLGNVLLDNAVLSVVLSLTLVFLMLWMLNRHLQRYNHVCEQVMEGNLDYRIRLHGHSDQFEKLSGNINRMLDWNCVLLDTVKDTSNAIAHDMRTPLSRLRLQLRSMAETQEQPEKLREELQGAVAQLDYMVTLFDNILKIAKAESKEARTLFEYFDLRALVEDVLDLYESVLEEKNKPLLRHMTGQSIHLLGDRHLIGQSLVNLLENTLKYSPPETPVDVFLHASAQEISLQVADRGAGIAPELREKVTGRFFRADKSRHSEGVGLGLCLVNAVMILHGGRLSLLDNNPGLRVELSFPRK